MASLVFEDMEKLFLLEVLVDHLVINNEVSTSLGKDSESNSADTCVTFQFLHYPPLVLCEEDLMSLNMRSNLTSRKGKSCFFSLRVPKEPIVRIPFDVKVGVTRKMKEGSLPDKTLVGKTSIDMSDSFTELLKQKTEDNCDQLPLTKIIKDSFELKDDSGKKTGSISVFLRISCFGKLIITQFSLTDKDSFLFKGTDMSQICKEEALKAKKENIPGADDIMKIEPSGHFEAQKRDKELKKGEEERHSPDKDLSTLESSKEDDEDDMTHFAITDKTGRRKKKKKRGSRKKMIPDWEDDHYDPNNFIYSSRQARAMPGVGTYGPQPMMMQAGYPYPISSMGGGGDGGRFMSRYTKRTEGGLELAPGEVGLQDDQVIFQLPLKKPGDPLTDRDQQLDSQVYYKLTSAEETREGFQKNTVNIKSDDIPGKETQQVGPVSGLPVDDSHDVFLLKIGKKCEGDKKRNLELELRAPKMKEPKPPTTEKETQYLESDIAPFRPSKGGKKGSKGGKGGKGKKGKK